MSQYLGIDTATAKVICARGIPDPEGFVGPPSEPPVPVDGTEFRLWQAERLSFGARPTPTSELVWVDGAPDPQWVEVGSLSEIQAVAIAEVDRLADVARLQVVGDAARIKEYERAQAGAEAYRDAGFTGTVPPGVASWAYAKRRSGWTTQQAAEDILAASARWYAALDGIRALRLDAKEAIRFSETGEEVEGVASVFRSTLTAAMQGVQ